MQMPILQSAFHLTERKRFCTASLSDAGNGSFFQVIVPVNKIEKRRFFLFRVLAPLY